MEMVMPLQGGGHGHEVYGGEPVLCLHRDALGEVDEAENSQGWMGYKLCKGHYRLLLDAGGKC